MHRSLLRKDKTKQQAGNISPLVLASQSMLGSLAILLVEAMQKDITVFYKGVRKFYNSLSQMALPSNRWRTIRMFRDNYP